MTVATETYSKYVTQGWQEFKPHDFPDTRVVIATISIKWLNFQVLFSSKIFCYYMFWDENLLTDFLLKKNHEMIPCEHKNVCWICVLNLKLRLWNQHIQNNNLHFLLTQDLTSINSKTWACNLQICKSQVCEL